jgi:serine/threonine-protein kinase
MVGSAVLETGTRVGRYEIVGVLGEGDLASTYKVIAEGVPYAMRVLHVREHGFGERLLRGAEAQAGLHHPNLLDVIEVIDAEGKPALVTEFVDGTDLERWTAAGPHRPAEILVLFRQMVEGVEAAHRAGLLHRNLKPGKVLIGRDVEGRPQTRIADFLLGKVRQSTPGAAPVTQMGTTFGTPQYMAPEQFRGASTVDERGDLFALGCLLYEMTTGQRAFSGTGLVEVYQRVATCRYTPIDEVRPGLPPWIGETVRALLVADPNGRVRSATELLARLPQPEADELEDLPTVENDEVPAPPTPARGGLPANALVWLGVFVLLAGGFALTAVVVLVVVVASLW